jgi:hypothetical protein
MHSAVGHTRLLTAWRGCAQVDITAPYVGNYSKNTPEFEKALQQ